VSRYREKCLQNFVELCLPSGLNALTSRLVTRAALRRCPRQPRRPGLGASSCGRWPSARRRLALPLRGEATEVHPLWRPSRTDSPC